MRLWMVSKRLNFDEARLNVENKQSGIVCQVLALI
jgi:hypothetical protein